MIDLIKQPLEQQLNLGKIGGKEVTVNFDGGNITSDAGIILISELDKKLEITSSFAKCFQDHRHSSYIDYSVDRLLAQRIYAIALGYEDVNDHDKLRHDPAWAIALDRISAIDSNQSIMAGKSTINRLEYCPKEILDQSKSRDHKIEHQPEEIEKNFIDIFLNSYDRQPKEIILDLDVTNDPVHGNQSGAFFNAYYDEVCYAPLYIFCGHHLLVSKLRSSNVDPADGGLEELQRVIKLIKEKWKETQIIVRGDSAYAREEIMNFCEQEENVNYILAMATNTRLKSRAFDTIEKAKCDYEQRLEPVTKLMETLFAKEDNLEEVRKLVPNSTWFRSINYQTEKSWSCQRRVVTKVCYGSEGLTIHHVVTSLAASKISPSLLHQNKYCPRGEMENRIKEQQLDLFADRTSTQTFESNQLRLWLSSMAYVLMQAFRENCLSQTPLAKSTVGTIRLNLLKIGARITISTRRVVIAIASIYQFKDILEIAHSRIEKISNSG
jgi:Transposase DDE domain group 1